MKNHHTTAYLRWRLGLSVAALAVIAGGGPALAQDGGAQRQGPTINLGIGPGFYPEHEGSDEYRAIPFIVGRAQWGARRFVGTDGEGLRADLFSSRFVEAGPAVTFRFARKNSVSDDRVAALRPVDVSVEVGAFAALNFPFPMTQNRRDALTIDASYLTDMAGGHDGQVARFRLRYRGQLSEKWVVQAGPFATWASNDFMDAYYSVSPTEAAGLGVTPFQAVSGMKDYGFRFNARYTFAKPWAITGSLTARQYINDAADSPVVAAFGSKTTYQGGFALTRTF